MTSRRRFGRLRKLPSGRWQARYPGPDGLLRTAPDTFATKTDADRFLAGVETDMARGVWLDGRTASATLRAYAEGWLKQRTVKGRPLAPRTVDTYRQSLDAWILPSLGGLSLDKITPSIVRSWHADVAAKTGRTATRKAYALLHAILATAVDDEALHRNPCRIAGAGLASSPERPLLEIEQVETLIAAMPERLQVPCIVMFWAQLRLGEVLAVEHRDFDRKAATLRVERQVVEVDGIGPVVTEPKAGSRRTVHLPVQALDALTKHVDRAGPALPTARLFTRPDGSELRAHHLQGPWQTARTKVGFPDVHLHDLRHAGLTLTAQAGATLAEVMRRAGYVTSRAAMIYQHAAERRDAEVAKKLSKMATVRKISNRRGTRGARGDQQAR
jgi:integrase